MDAVDRQDLYVRRAGQEHEGTGGRSAGDRTSWQAVRPGRGERAVTVTADAWKELHVTFQVAKPFPQGWFAYVSCNQPDSEFRLDVFRLYEGEYVAYHKAARQEAMAAAVGLFDTGVSSAASLADEAIRSEPAGPRCRKTRPIIVPRRRRGGERSPGRGPARGGQGAEVYCRPREGHALRVLAPTGVRPGPAPDVGNDR